jgi:methionyl-tRNA formyltransferase
LKLVFAGTPDFAVPTLELLLQSEHEVVSVYTQPDRPAGRGRKLTASPVKQVAQKHHVNILQPETLRSATAASELAGLQPDIMIVVAYGLILPPDILSVPAYGCLNVHASLLPRWRGAAPIQRAILAGDKQTGVTIMQMDTGLDTGDMLKQSIVPISTETTARQLHDELAVRGAEDLMQVVEQFDSEKPPVPQKQDDTIATYADKLTKQEARIDWREAADVVLRKIKAFNPWPVAHTSLHGKILRIWDAEMACLEREARPGELITSTNGIPVIACGAGAITLLELQPEGKKRMSSQAFMNARKADTQPGIILGEEQE